MKKITRTVFFILFLISLNSYAEVSLEQARNLAKEYAMDSIFGELIEATSSMRIESERNLLTEFVFEVGLTNFLGNGGPGTEYEICVSRVHVNQQTGKASHNDPMVCRDPREKPETIEKDVNPLAMRSMDSWPYSNQPLGSRIFRVEIDYCTLNEATTPHIIGEIYLLTPGEVYTGSDVKQGTVKHFTKFINANYRQVKNVSPLASAQPCKKATTRQLLACTMREGVFHTMCQYHFNEQEQITFDVYSDGSFNVTPKAKYD